MEKTDDCQIMPKQIVNPSQQAQYEYQYYPISGEGKLDNTNNVYQEMQHLRKVQGADLYMTNNMLQSKTNSKSKHLPPNNWDRLKKLKLPTLSFRRVRGDMIELYKILYDKYDREAAPFIKRWKDVAPRAGARVISNKLYS